MHCGISGTPSPAMITLRQSLRGNFAVSEFRPPNSDLLMCFVRFLPLIEADFFHDLAHGLVCKVGGLLGTELCLSLNISLI